jgi:hypothetical protein
VESEVIVIAICIHIAITILDGSGGWGVHGMDEWLGDE